MSDLTQQIEDLKSSAISELEQANVHIQKAWETMNDIDELSAKIQNDLNLDPDYDNDTDTDKVSKSLSYLSEMVSDCIRNIENVGETEDETEDNDAA